MAHQKGSLPWDLVAANLFFRPETHGRKPRPTNLYLRSKPNQKTDLKEFAEAFATIINHDIQQEREKYPAKYPPPELDDLILDDALTLKITPTVAKWRTKDTDFEPKLPATPSTKLCPHHKALDYYSPYKENELHCWLGCECPIPYSERKAAAFLHPRTDDCGSCYTFYSENGKGFFNLEIVKTLLLSGDIDPILRVCAYPDVKLTEWKDVGTCSCVPSLMGWNWLFMQTLHIYLVLNILACFPELCPHTSTPPPSPPASTSATSEYECTKITEQSNANTPCSSFLLPPPPHYRNTKLYQSALHRVTKSTQSEITTYLHRRFFGIPDDNFSHGFNLTQEMHIPALALALEKDYKDNYPGESMTEEPPILLEEYFPYGQVPFKIFLKTGSKGREPAYLPLPSEKNVIWTALSQKGLPTELILLVLKFAGYEEGSGDQERELPIPHDPLHPGNREVLEKYLERCWGLLMRCGVFAREIKADINWTREVWDLFRLVEHGSTSRANHLG
ncbi:hypothetical protein BJY04DRAFT_207343 [Aspergillus karnatakaensis]|uniref:uncharacterized protein n=1 Tax=Aspergillus karnatakaensis TaxID=1810916 RepID=UPI003CCE4DD2